MNLLDYEFIQFKNFDNIGKDIEEFVDLDENSYITIDNIDDNIQIDDLVEDSPELMERLIYINHKYFYNDIKKSYKTNTNIYEQFVMDFYRNKFFINNNLVDNVDDIKNYLEYKFPQSDKVTQIMMLSTQSIMGLPFQILQNSIFPKNLYVSELPNNTELYKGFGISINIINDRVEFCARKYLRIFKLSKIYDDQTTYIIKIKLDFELDTQKDVILKVVMNKI